MKNIVHWILDKDLFSEYTDKLVESINKNGSAVHIFDEIKENSFNSFLYYNKLKNVPIILHGSLQQADIINKFDHYPGVYLELDNYECSKYYGYYGNKLLNSNYVMMGMNDIIRNYRSIFKSFDSDKIFIRPSNGYKSFPGQLLPLDNFEFEFNVLKQSYGGLNMDDLVVLAPYKEIINEYRFIVVDNEVVTGSLYMNKESRKSNNPIFDQPCDALHPATLYANSLVNLYTPDNAYTLDVCETALGFHLLEINSFCCANMYGANLDNVVKAINKIVIKDYNDIN